MPMVPSICTDVRDLLLEPFDLILIFGMSIICLGYVMIVGQGRRSNAENCVLTSLFCVF